jgi:hypothetical protein
LFERIKSLLEAVLILVLIYVPINGISAGLEGKSLRAAGYLGLALVAGFFLFRLHDAEDREFRERAARLREELGRRQ